MRLTPTNDESATIIKWFFIGIAVIFFALVIWSFGHAIDDCHKQGGEYVKTLLGGYKCVKELDNG